VESTWLLLIFRNIWTFTRLLLYLKKKRESLPVERRRRTLMALPFNPERREK
jgi:hypothetical protein